MFQIHPSESCDYKLISKQFSKLIYTTLFTVSLLLGSLIFYRYLISVLSIVPPKKKPELYNQALAVSENQVEVFRSGIIDKTAMNEAVEPFWHEICYMGKVLTLSFSS